MKYIPLNKEKFALIDDEDFNLVSNYNWHFNESGYARTSTPKKLYMHRLILGAQKGQICDHINGNRLDNRQSNLRFCNQSENRKNQGLRSNNRSGYKGVSWAKEKKKWTVRIRINGKAKYLGYYIDKVEAAKVYNKYALENYGEFARLNKV